MRHFWDSILLPLFKKIKPKYIIEIGSEEGINTEKILNYCVENHAILTTIDPKPLFDEVKLKNKFNNNFKLIRDLSLNCLDNLDDYDIVLIDGDHNWYTVYNELKLIEKKFINKKFPVIILHDIGWPYGRRDLYYNPKTIPKEFLNPYDQKGIIPDQIELADTGGFNSNLNNAIFENTPKNGVLTAIEDFLNESSSDLLFSKVLVFFGLGIIYPNDDIKFIVEDVISNSDISFKLEKHYLNEKIMLLDKITMLNSSIIFKNNKINELEDVNLKLTSDNSILNDEKIHLSNLNNELSKDISHLTSLNNELSKDISHLTSLNNELSKDISHLTNSKNNLLNEIDNLSKLNMRLADENIELFNIKQTLQTKNKKLNIKLDNYLDLVDENKKLVNRNKILTQTKFHLFEENKKLNAEKLIISNNNIDLINEHKRLSDKANKLNASFLQYKIEKEKLIDELILENNQLKNNFYFKLLNKFKSIFIKIKNIK